MIEDIDLAPLDVLSILVTLLERRELHIPGRGDVVHAARGFQLFATQALTATGACACSAYRVLCAPPHTAYSPTLPFLSLTVCLHVFPIVLRVLSLPSRWFLLEATLREFFANKHLVQLSPTHSHAHPHPRPQHPAPTPSSPPRVDVHAYMHAHSYPHTPTYTHNPQVLRALPRMAARHSSAICGRASLCSP